MARVNRYDVGELLPPKKDGNGWLRADGFIGRSGTLTYRRADGSKWVEYRPPDEAFNADAIESFEAVPFTNDHPPAGRLDASNTKEFQVGTVSNVRQDGGRIRARVLITDAKTIADLESGKAELSMGYSCDVDDTSGVTPEGERYDAVQKNIRGNHVALVMAGRAGPEYRLRVDSLDTEMYSPFTVTVCPEKAPLALAKMKFDGVEVELEESIAKAVTAQADKAQAKADAAQAKIDGLEKQLIDLNEKLAKAPAEALAKVQARAALEAKAAKHIEKADGLSDLELKRAVAEKLSGMKLDGKSEAYVDAAFDMALATAETVKPAPLTAPFNTDSNEPSDPVAEAQKKFNEAVKKNFNRSEK